MTLEPPILTFPAHLQVPGAASGTWETVAAVGDVPPGMMIRVTRGDLDVLVAHTTAGLVAADDRCPHMSAPLSQGQLDGCVVDCPLHSGSFDLASGDALRFPTTGGLDADGGYHPPWQQPGSPARTEPTDAKASARAATRVRRIRYYPLRVRDCWIEIAFPRP